MAITPCEYYGDSTNHGDYQYVSLDDMVTNFILNYVGDDKLINNTHRLTVLFHMKRGLQELNYDALKEIKVIAYNYTIQGADPFASGNTILNTDYPITSGRDVIFLKNLFAWNIF